jgi:hypothetical protein
MRRPDGTADVPNRCGLRNGDYRAGQPPLLTLKKRPDFLPDNRDIAVVRPAFIHAYQARGHAKLLCRYCFYLSFVRHTDLLTIYF